jgi:hypothetical protein
MLFDRRLEIYPGFCWITLERYNPLSNGYQRLIFFPVQVAAVHRCQSPPSGVKGVEILFSDIKCICVPHFFFLFVRGGFNNSFGI